MTLSEADFLSTSTGAISLLGGGGLLCLGLAIIVQLRLRDTVADWLRTFYMAFVVCFCTAVIVLTIIKVAAPLQALVQVQQPPSPAQTEVTE